MRWHAGAQFVQLIQRGAAPGVKVAGIRHRRCLVAELVDVDLAALVIHRGHKVGGDDFVIDDQSCFILVGGVFGRGALGLDEVHGRDGRVAEIIKNCERGRVGKALGVVGVKRIAVCELVLGGDNFGVGGQVDSQINHRRRLWIT